MCAAVVLSLSRETFIRIVSVLSSQFYCQKTRNVSQTNCTSSKIGTANVKDCKENSDTHL